MRDTDPHASLAGWRHAWETSLFGDNHWLHAFARNSTASHKVMAIHEDQGQVVVEVQQPARRQVKVTITLPHLSPDLCLEKMDQLALRQGQEVWDWLDHPRWEFFHALDQMGLKLWPAGTHEVHVTVAPGTGLRPCPCTLTALMETGWLLELDPLLLLRMRGLAPEALRHRRGQQQRKGADPGPHSGQDAPVAQDSAASSWERLRFDHFWGNARALRTYSPSHNPETSLFMPASTMGAPQVESEEGQRFLSRLLQDLYAQGGSDASDAGH